MEAYIHFPISALGPHLMQTHVGPVHTASLLCEFLCALLLLCLEGLVSLVSSIPLAPILFLKDLLIYLYFMCMGVLPAYMPVYHMLTETFSSSGTGITDGMKS